MGGKLGYRPALDGVRAVAIALVLAFHLGAPWLPGGYLGVSVFFTLSGFLITSLLLSERELSGRIDVRAFYVRRLRRLLPASLICLTGIAVLASTGAIAARGDLRGGVLGALAQVANWEQLLGDRSYADLFVAPSPVDHFWSLAIEEQFYWVWPLAMAGLTATVSHRALARVLAGGFVALGASALLTARVLGGDAAYFASWARFAEIVAGAALAAIVAHRRVPVRAAALAPVCLAAIVVLAAVTPAGRGWAYGGGLPLFAILSAGLVLGVQASGPVARVLSWEPIPWIGRISYGLYLFHWPVFTILGDAGVAEKLAMTFGIAVASYYLIERPIRTGRVLASPASYVRAAGAAAAVAAVAVVALVPVVHRPARSAEPVVVAAVGAPPAPAGRVPETTDGLPAAVSGGAGAPSAALAAPAAPGAARGPRVVALFGDSIADWLLRDATPSFDRTDITLVDAAVEGCDAARGIPEARGHDGRLLPVPDDCEPWPDIYPAVVENPDLPVDVAVLVVGNAPIVDRKVDGSWIGPCEDMTWYVDDLDGRVAYLRARVGDVVLVLPSWGGDKASFLATDDHLERSACIRDALAAFAAAHEVDTVDLADVLCPAGPSGECSDLREADGTHVDPDDAPFVLDWLLDHVAVEAPR